MPRSCCVPRCNSNYLSYISSFAFPKDEQLRRKWIAAIHREVSFVPTQNTVVSSKHFLESEIITVDTITRPDDSILTCPRKIPKLQPTAIPTIFPNQPSYMTVKLPQKRKDPEQRTQELLDGDIQKFRFADNLASHEKLINILFDEIHIAPKVEYKGGVLRGLTEKNEVANKIQAFMLSSVFSKNEDIIALYPVKKKSSEMLKIMTLDIIKILTDLANIGDLKHIHGKECHSTVKLAPALSQKVLHPSSLERQNVSLAVRLFDEKNIAALNIIQKGNVGTAEFLKIILSWWKIVNVRSSKAGIHLKHPLREPITSPDHDSI
nr:unnamed protein product [Callosobruchus analis]